jgi:hypothetical protein
LGRRERIEAVDKSQQQRKFGESAGATLRRSASKQNLNPYAAASPLPIFPQISWSNQGIEIQPHQSLGAQDQDFSWINSDPSTYHEAESLSHYAQSHGGSSGAASVASCSSYMAFGPRKGRRVAYGGASPGIAPTTPPTDSWGWRRDSEPSEPPEFGLWGPLLMHDTQPAPDEAAYQSSYMESLNDAFSNFEVPLATEMWKPGDAEFPEVSAANAYVQSSGDSAFQCTFCGNTFNKKYTWQRHEEAVHAPPRVWVCEPSAFAVDGHNRHSDHCRRPICSISCFGPEGCGHRFEECWERPEKDRTYFRKDALVQHLRLMHHSIPPLLARYEGREFDVPAGNLICPFCDNANATWQERVEHVAEHFKEGERLPSSRWNKKKINDRTGCFQPCLNVSTGRNVGRERLPGRVFPETA